MLRSGEHLPKQVCLQGLEECQHIWRAVMFQQGGHSATLAPKPASVLPQGNNHQAMANLIRDKLIPICLYIQDPVSKL